MIKLDKLIKTYGKGPSAFNALDGITLDIPEHQSVAIVGKSGSGKSTLMQIMSGLDRPTSGSITMGKYNLQAMPRKQVDMFRATQMSFIFQAFFVEPNQTCRQNVSLPLEIAGVPRKDRNAKVSEALAAVDLSDKINELAGALSGGQKQRLAIARAIVNKPQIIFADEPTGNLDSSTGDQIIRLLLDLNLRQKCTVIIVTHDKDLASRCQVQIAMKDGRIESVNKKRLTI